jgi:hypothetical protein
MTNPSIQMLLIITLIIKTADCHQVHSVLFSYQTRDVADQAHRVKNR